MNEEENIELRSEEFQEVLGGVPPWILRWGISILAIIVIILLIGSAILKYPDIISARIVLTGSVPPAEIVARSSGKLKELYVIDNQEVKSGDYLAVIDNPAHTQDILTLKEYMERLDIEKNSLLFLPETGLRVGNLQSIYSSFYICLFNYLEYKRLLYYPQKIEMTRERIIQYEEQYRNLLRQQKLTDEQFTLTQKQFQRDSLLRSNGVISQEELEKSQSVYVQSKLSNENMHSSLNNMKIQIAQLKESLLDTGHQDIEALNGLRTQLQSLISQIKTEIQAWEISYVLKAPINGKITFTNYWIMNQNVSAGEDIFTIIPGNAFSIIGKASLPIARSGKVEIGQKVNIRIENFPENEYGILRGRVQNISLIPTQSSGLIYYTVEISLPDKLITTYKKELPFLPNMQGQADIITEDISLLERFVLPIKKILKENL
ncbi:hemolysin [Bacteroidia bacterium]|nr:hemolysin [Bacteroidia bacterium]